MRNKMAEKKRCHIAYKCVTKEASGQTNRYLNSWREKNVLGYFLIWDNVDGWKQCQWSYCGRQGTDDRNKMECSPYLLFKKNNFLMNFWRGRIIFALKCKKGWQTTLTPRTAKRVGQQQRGSDDKAKLPSRPSRRMVSTGAETRERERK